jgi:beta-lactamase class C
MRYSTKALIAAALAAVVGWQFLPGETSETLTQIAPALARERSIDLPDAPEEWRGKVDYAALDAQLSALTANPQMAGLAVAVIEDGRLSFVRTYGLADRSTGAHVSADTLFRWASVSKTVAGTFAASLANEGTVDLGRPVAQWRSTLRLPGGAESRITLAQLLAHQTGLTKNAYDERLEDGQSPATIRGQLAGAPVQCQPGTCHTYQNVAFDAASEIFATATGRNFADSVAERYFLPLGMTSASYGMSGLTGAKDWARPHSGAQVRTLKESYWRVPAAAGVESNIVDFARWMHAAMGLRPEVLSPEVLQRAQAPLVTTPRPYGGTLRAAITDASYGLGWRSFSYQGHRLIGHSGAVDGFRATMIFDPQTRTGVAALWNSNWGRPFRIPFAVFDSYDGRAEADWLELAALASASEVTE